MAATRTSVHASGTSPDSDAAWLPFHVFAIYVFVQWWAQKYSDGGGILVSWHPNGMIDPALIFETFPRAVVFGARHGLFKVPVLGAMMWW